ncbi:MAG TPA: hypothetical protein VGP79_04165 [Bryobacteraceae bacterium]|nr:hypothetical protein [Bryobacteraceae bacterium]
MWRPILWSLLLAAGQAAAQQVFQPTIVAAEGGSSQVLYGRFNSTLVKSTDLGKTWIPLYVTEAGLAQPSVVALEIDATSPSVLYLATTVAEGLFWKSSDGGATWKKASTGLPPPPASVGLLRQVSNQGQALYLRMGAQLYKSTDRAEHWTLQTTLLGSENNFFEISLLNPSKMYYVEGASLNVRTTDDEGRTWRLAGTLSVNITSRSANGVGILYSNPNTVFVSIAGCCPPGGGLANNIQGIYRSDDGGATFAWLGPGNGAGEPFTRMFTGPSSEIYALSANAGGFLRSRDGRVFNSFFNYPTTGFTNLTAIDPQARSVLYGLATTAGAVRSTNAGDSFTKIDATITPTLAKSPLIQIAIEAGAPYSQPFSVQLFENPAWVLPVTLTKTAPWLTLGVTSGSTPIATTLTVDSTGLAPGTYTTSIRVDAPASFNKFVTIPVELTVRERGSLGPQYRISTVAGNGQAAGSVTSGKATDIGIGFPGGLAVDSQGRLLFTTTSRLWRLTDTNLEVLAGNGTSSSTGDGGDPKVATVNAQAVALNAQGDIFLSEAFSPPKIRRIANGVISAYLDKTKMSSYNGSLALGVDSIGRLLLVDSRLFVYDGQNLAQLSTFSFSSGAAGVAVGPDGTIYVSDQSAHRVMRVAPNGNTDVFAGTGAAGFSGDGGPATQAQLNRPVGLALDSKGTLYIADRGNHRVRAIASDGTIRTIAGSGVQGFAGDGETANFAAFNSPYGLAIDRTGAIYVGDGSQRIRKLVLETTPVPRPSALLHGASGSPKLSPGSLFSLYGELLATSTRITGDTPWPRTIDGVIVTINGIAAPLYFISPTQINGQIPFETAVGTATATITVNGSAPIQVTFQVVPANPGVLVYNGNRAVAVNPNGSVNASNAPALPGDVELLYFSGIGVPEVPVATGAGSPSAEPLGRAKYPFEIRLNGQPVEVFYLGLAPGFPALCQANFRIPSLPPGDYQLTIIVNGEVSNTVILSVGAG